MQRSRFIPLRRQELLAHMDPDPAFRRAAGLLHHLLRHEADARNERLRAAYAPFDPDPLAETPLGARNERKFLALAEDVLEEANFRRLTQSELEASFEEKSLFPLHAYVASDEYEILRVYRRGVTQRTERVRGAATLWRWKERELTLFDRLVLVLRLKPHILETDRVARTEGMKAGCIYIKSFKNVPKRDVEMVLPNTKLRLRPKDKALIFGPLVVGIGITVYNSIGLVIALATGRIDALLATGSLQAGGGLLIAIAGYLWKTHAKVKTQRLQYMQTLSKGLYFRNLANNKSVLEQILLFAQDAEEKEALIAYHLLQRGPMRAGELDRIAEAWIEERTGRQADFDVVDGLETLDTMGLAKRRLGKWHAVDAKRAGEVLEEHWGRVLVAA